MQVSCFSDPPGGMSLPILNIAAYKFVALDDLGRRRRELRDFCRQRGLRGTILLSSEGINLFVAGKDEAVEQLVELVRAEPNMADLEVKRSRSMRIPFRRMLVKVKREIISFGVDGVDPIGKPAPKVSPRQLREWLDEGRPLTLLDVRNDYEVQLGTFSHAKSLRIDHFREFPAAARQLPEELKTHPVVMFCTGGIRCEKAGPMMEQAGFQDVVQLDGGILKYFEECGGAHYRGECFVFDQRVSLDSNLAETSTTQCYACQATLSLEDQASPKYLPGEACPRCYKSPIEQMSARIAARHRRLSQLARPLPGSVPYENRRPLNVPGRCDGFTLLDMLSSMHPQVDRAQWNAWCLAGQLRRDDRPLAPSDEVRAGQRIERVESQTVEPDVNADIRILYEDAMLVVVNKPAPLPMHASGRFHRNTLTHIMDRVYAPQRLRVAHRLDANTTGVAVLSRTRNVASRLQPQFQEGLISKQYLARVHGQPSEEHFRCEAPISPRPMQAGARQTDEQGLSALTEFEVLQPLRDGTTYLLVRPITGRTNQIRLHLAHLGWPIVGDPLYQQHGMGDRQTLQVGEAPLCLHAWRIALRHPEDNRRIEFEAPLPEWAGPLRDRCSPREAAIGKTDPTGDA